jgi:hypothetical protein
MNSKTQTLPTDIKEPSSLKKTQLNQAATAVAKSLDKFV